MLVGLNLPCVAKLGKVHEAHAFQANDQSGTIKSGP
jgi:hypothetical protein